MKTLQEEKWVDNRTRALFVEFSTYNAQVNMFSTITCTAEFIGGGVYPYYRIDVFKLMDVSGSSFATLVRIAEVLFVASLFYYVINVITVMKKEGCRQFFNSSYNISDLVTVILSVIALVLYVAKQIVTSSVIREISETKGNKYIRLTYVAILNMSYEYLVAITVFTSTIKFSRLLSFQKAFMQITATMKLCFQGMASFVIEFMIVFGAFCSFFFFVLKNDLEDFRDYFRTVENTMAMSIGKFNFAALRAADEMAAWIFFAFSIVVNMILINMMMAIINLAFEEIKANAHKYRNKFELVEYIKRSIREVVGTTLAKPIKNKYRDIDDDDIDDSDREDMDQTEKTSENFSKKTDQLMDYINSTYFADGMSEEDRKMMEKMKRPDKKIMDYGFDAVFQEKN